MFLAVARPKFSPDGVPVAVKVLILYDAYGRQITRLAQAIAEGVGQVEGATANLVLIRDAQREDLLACDALILGSPNWSGITGSMKSWLDGQGDLWEEGVLEGKVGAAFTTSRGRSSGVEFLLWTLIHWMLACGMVMVGLPWSERMRTSGSYYGATAHGEATQEDEEQGRTLGGRVAQFALRLQASAIG